jgi:hypothetical protein
VAQFSEAFIREDEPDDVIGAASFGSALFRRIRLFFLGGFASVRTAVMREPANT